MIDMLLDDAEATLPVRVSTVYRVPSSRLFQAWTQPSEIKAWFGRPHCKIVRADTDLRVGGKWQFAYSRTSWFEGVYSKIVENECLAFTWRHVCRGNLSPISEVLVEFSSTHDKTKMTITHHNLQSDSGRKGVSTGWQGSVAALSDIFRGER